MGDPDMDLDNLRVCAADGCAYRLMSRLKWRELTVEQRAPLLAAGVRSHHRRGLCSRCHSRAVRAGTLEDYERKLRPILHTLADYYLLRSDGLSDRQIADRLGIKRQSLVTALYRARRAGLIAA